MYACMCVCMSGTVRNKTAEQGRKKTLWKNYDKYISDVGSHIV